MKRKRFAVFILLFAIFFLVGCENKSNELSKLKEKTYAEVKYLENNIDGILRELLVNKYEENKKADAGEKKTSNKEENDKKDTSSKEKNDSSEGEEKEYSEEKNSTEEHKKYEVNWNEVNNEIERIYSTWGDLAIDLNKLGTSNDDILAFGNEINNAKIAINAKQEDMIIKSLSNLYLFIPKYMGGCVDNSFDIAKKNIKYNIITSACMARFGDWEQTERCLDVAENDYIKLMNNEEYANKNQYNINRIYILLEELKKTVSTNELEVFLLKYKVLIDEL